MVLVLAKVNSLLEYQLFSTTIIFENGDRARDPEECRKKERRKCFEKEDKSIRAINGLMNTVSAIRDHFNKEGSSVFQA